MQYDICQHLFTLEVCKTSCLSGIFLFFLNQLFQYFQYFNSSRPICLYFLNQLLRNLSENSRKVTRTGRQPRTCESDYPKTENRNQKLDKRNQKKRKQMQEIRNVSKTGRQPCVYNSDCPIAFSVLNTLRSIGLALVVL